MAKRLTTRISAGAAVITGLGMMGVAVAVPAQAATTMQYECTTPIGAQIFDVALDTDAPGEIVAGSELSVTPSGTVTLNADTSNAMAGFLGWEYVEGDIPGVVATVSNGTDQADVTTDLSIPRTHIFDSDNGGWTQDDTPDLPVTGTTETTTIEATGEYTVSAPTSFEATFTGLDAAEQPKGDPITSVCTYVEGSGSLVIDTVSVVEQGTEPTEPEPTEPEPTTPEPTTPEPTEPEPTTPEPTTPEPTTPAPTEPTTPEPSTPANPEVPEVVQTDGLTPASLAGSDNTAALAAGGLLLAGTGAGAVLVVRRRAAQH